MSISRVWARARFLLLCYLFFTFLRFCTFVSLFNYLGVYRKYQQYLFISLYALHSGPFSPFRNDSGSPSTLTMFQASQTMFRTPSASAALPIRPTWDSHPCRICRQSLWTGPCFPVRSSFSCSRPPTSFRDAWPLMPLLDVPLA